MFGYVNIYKPELKMKDFYKYKAYYCGLCKTLKEKYRMVGQLTLSYDMTFLIILLTSLYESDTKRSQNRCIIHPMKKHDTLRNEFTDYVADMNIALSYYHLLDDWKDEKSVVGLAGFLSLKGAFKKVNKKYPRQCEVIRSCLNNLQEYEKRQETDLDTVSRCFGELMAELFVYRKDNWEEYLRKIGFYLGKFIYILDAYDDLKKDIKSKNYNPLIQYQNDTDLHEKCKDMLTMMVAEVAKEFEKLPCLLDADILRNILYEGVWTKFDIIEKEKNAKSKQDQNTNQSKIPTGP